MDKLLYVESKILEEDYSLLSDDIAIGPVYKINGSFSIENDGYLKCLFCFLLFFQKNINQYLSFYIF